MMLDYNTAGGKKPWTAIFFRPGRHEGGAAGQGPGSSAGGWGGPKRRKQGGTEGQQGVKLVVFSKKACENG
jgi:hypothetical protein